MKENIYLILSIIIVFLGAGSIYFYGKYIGYKKIVTYLNYCDKSIQGILFDNYLDNDEKIMRIKENMGL